MRTENKDKELNHRHFIGLRLTDVELDLLDQGAACLSVSRSEYLRKLLLEKQIHHQIEVHLAGNAGNSWSIAGHRVWSAGVVLRRGCGQNLRQFRGGHRSRETESSPQRSAMRFNAS